ncbi:hypothetical protein JYJ95_42210 [Corallococcus exiguus]|uniref:hypothetical protein n=1 Tax=Corallococcus exiguus TaxID=83462 RepID=UPI001A8FE606|nr:hypothetical protein [Corallococcus exiguus]MBN8473157.1 hypothetical protein [Corallococcus exiguus]
MSNEGTPPDEGARRRTSSRRNWSHRPAIWLRKGTWLALVFISMVGVFIWLQGGENRALDAMSPSQREALSRTPRDEFRLLCLADGGASRWPKKCANHAAFLVRFSECDDTCRREVEPFLPHPTR